jgi:hypothetical protein
MLNLYKLRKSFSYLKKILLVFWIINVNAQNKAVWDIGSYDVNDCRKWYITYGDGNGSFGQETEFLWPVYSKEVAKNFTGDFNGDGFWDIGSYDVNDCRKWYIMYGDGNGSFGQETEFLWPVYSKDNANIFTGDFNGDGFWDIGAYDVNNCRKWYIMYGDGHGSFGNETEFVWPVYSKYVAKNFTGDFNGDGFWDIGSYDVNNCRKWYIMYGDGHGSFDNETEYIWNIGSKDTTNIFTGDFNGDGFWDIGAYDINNDRNWYIRYGDGRGSFGQETKYYWPVYSKNNANIFTGKFRRSNYIQYFGWWGGGELFRQQIDTLEETANHCNIIWYTEDEIFKPWTNLAYNNGMLALIEAKEADNPNNWNEWVSRVKNNGLEKKILGFYIRKDEPFPVEYPSVISMAQTIKQSFPDKKVQVNFAWSQVMDPNFYLPNTDCIDWISFSPLYGDNSRLFSYFNTLKRKLRENQKIILIGDAGRETKEFTNADVQRYIKDAHIFYNLGRQNTEVIGILPWIWGTTQDASNPDKWHYGIHNWMPEVCATWKTIGQEITNKSNFIFKNDTSFLKSIKVYETENSRITVSTTDNNEINIFPNPSNSTFEITYTSSQNFGFKIYNYTGKLVLKNIGYNIPFGNDLKPGVYFLKLKLDNREVIKKIIKF